MSVTGPKTPDDEIYCSEWYVHAVERLIAAVQDLSHARNIETVTSIVAAAARELVGADGATFVLRDDDKCFYVDEDAISPLWKGQRFPMSACVSGWAMMNARPAVIDDIYEDDRVPADAYKPTFVKSMTMVPIRQESPIGAIGTYWAVKRHTRDEEVRILQALANATSVTLENLELQRRLEESLQMRERAMFDNVREGILIFDEKGTISAFNQACEAILGYGKDEVMGKSIAKMLPAVYSQALLGRHIDRLETLTRKDGETFLAELSIAEFPIDGTVCFSAIIRDITERRQTERRLRESEQRYELALRGSNDGLWDWDLTKDVLYWSDRFKEILGITDKAFSPSYEEFKKRLHPDDYERITQQLEMHTKTQIPYDTEFRMQHVSGEYVWVRACGASISGEDGRTTRMAGSLTDITKKKQSQQDLAKAQAEVETVQQDKTAFIRNVSVGFQEPLVHIISAINNLSQDKMIMKAYSNDIDNIYKTADSLLVVVGDMDKMANQRRAH